MRPDELCENLQNNEYVHCRHDDQDLQSHQLQFQLRDDGVSDHATKVKRRRRIERMLFYFLRAIELIFCKDSFFVKHWIPAKSLF